MPTRTSREASFISIEAICFTGIVILMKNVHISSLLKIIKTNRLSTATVIYLSPLQYQRFELEKAICFAGLNFRTRSVLIVD